MRTSTCAKAVPERSHHARVEQHGVADLVAGGTAQPERVPDGERREVDRAVQRLQVVRVTDGRGAQEGHAAGTGAHLDDRDDRPRVDVARSLPARRPLDRPAEPEKRAPQLGACAPVLVRGIRPVQGVQAVDHHPDGRPLGPPSASRHQGSAREETRGASRCRRRPRGATARPPRDWPRRRETREPGVHVRSVVRLARQDESLPACGPVQAPPGRDALASNHRPSVRAEPASITPLVRP